MDKPTTEEVDPCDSEEFKEFQRRNHCSHISFDDLERWYFIADKELDALKADVERLTKNWRARDLAAEKAEAEVGRIRKDRDIWRDKAMFQQGRADEALAELALAKPLLEAAMMPEPEQKISLLTSPYNNRDRALFSASYDYRAGKEGK